MQSGKIKKLSDKGFGFISFDDGETSDIFFHASQLQNAKFDDLTEGQQVYFNVGTGDKGPRAEDVRT